MKPLVVLILTNCVALLLTRMFSGSFEYALSGRIAMSVMLLFTALGHFLYLKGMAMMLPGNIYAAVKRVNYQKATYDGPGPAYLWFRVPLQMLFIVWVYLCAIK